MAKNVFQYGGWNSYILQCGMWLWNHDSEFTKCQWQHPAMWYVALGWHAVAAPCNVTHSSGIATLNSPRGSTLQCGRWLWDGIPRNSPKRPPYWNSTPGFDFHHIIAVDMSFCTSLQNFIEIGPPLAEIMGSLKSPCTYTKYFQHLK